MSEQDLSPEEIQALEELAGVAETDPALAEEIIREGLVEAEQREHAEALLSMFDNATEHHQEQGRALLDAILRAESERSKQE